MTTKFSDFMEGKEEPRVLLIDECGAFVAVWLQTGMVSQGTTIHFALRNLLVTTRAQAEMDLAERRSPFSNLTAAAYTEFWSLFEGAEELPEGDEAVRQVTKEFQLELGRLYGPSEPRLTVRLARQPATNGKLGRNPPPQPKVDREFGLASALKVLTLLTERITPPQGRRHALSLESGGLIVSAAVNESEWLTFTLDEQDLTKSSSSIVDEIVALIEGMPKDKGRP
jgi:hypothetical protein